MATGDGVQKMPTLEEQVAQFKGFSTLDGEISDGKPTAEETAAMAARAAQAAAEKGEPVPPAADGKTPAAKAKTDDDDDDNEDAAALIAAAQAGGADGIAKLQKRLSKVSRERRKAQGALNASTARWDTERATLQAQIDELRRGQGATTKDPLTQKPAATTKADNVAGRPNKDDYQYGELDVKFIQDTARWEARQEIAEATARLEQQQKDRAAQAEADAERSKLTAFEEAGSKLYDDFSEVVIQGGVEKTYSVSTMLASMMMESDEGPHIWYALASDPKEAKRVKGLSLAGQAAWFGRQEAKWQADTATKKAKETPGTDTGAAKAKVSQAPQPIQGARGNTSTVPVTANTTDFAAFEALWKAQQAGK